MPRYSNFDSNQWKKDTKKTDFNAKIKKSRDLYRMLGLKGQKIVSKPDSAFRRRTIGVSENRINCDERKNAESIVKILNGRERSE